MSVLLAQLAGAVNQTLMLIARYRGDQLQRT